MTATNAAQPASLDAFLAAHPPTPAPVKSSAQWDAEDYAATVGENQRDNEQMADVDDRWMQERVDNWLERSA